MGIAIEVEVGKTKRLQRIRRGLNHAIGQIAGLLNVREMPLPLVGRLIALLAQHMPQSRDGRRQLAKRRQAQVGRHLRVLGVLTGEQNRA